MTKPSGFCARRWSLTRIFLSRIFISAIIIRQKECTAEAIDAYQKAFALGQETPSNQIYLGAAYAGAGEREKAEKILRTLETGENYVSPAELAVLYTALGNREEAFASLEKAFNLHDLQLQYLGTDPAFKPLRDDPRFADLLKRIGLPQ